MFERVVQLSGGFSDAGEDNFSGITAGLEDAEQLATGNDVETRARFGQEFQDGEIAIGFCRVANLVRDAAEGFFVGLELAEN